MRACKYPYYYDSRIYQFECSAFPLYRYVSSRRVNLKLPGYLTDRIYPMCHDIRLSYNMGLCTSIVYTGLRASIFTKNICLSFRNLLLVRCGFGYAPFNVRIMYITGQGISTFRNAPSFGCYPMQILLVLRTPYRNKVPTSTFVLRWLCFVALMKSPTMRLVVAQLKFRFYLILYTCELLAG